MKCTSYFKFFLAMVLVPLMAGCGHLFYHPTKYQYVEVSKIPVKPQDIEFQLEDQTKIHGWYFKSSDKPKGRILFFHGNAQNITSHFMGLYWMLEHGYDFMIFDYPGYGKSTGSPNQKTTTEAGLQALKWMESLSPRLPLIVYGQSLGGNIAMYSLSQHKPPETCLAIVESSFKSYRKVAQRVAASHWFTWILQPLAWLVMSDKYSAKNHIAQISPTPLLVIHGDQDNIVSIKNSEDIYAAASDPKDFWVVLHTRHIETFHGPQRNELRKRLLENIKQQCPLSALRN